MACQQIRADRASPLSLRLQSREDIGRVPIHLLESGAHGRCTDCSNPTLHRRQTLSLGHGSSCRSEAIACHKPRLLSEFMKAHPAHFLASFVMSSVQSSVARPGRPSLPKQKPVRHPPMLLAVLPHAACAETRLASRSRGIACLRRMKSQSSSMGMATLIRYVTETRSVS
jgi:hypothetical protein